MHPDEADLNGAEERPSARSESQSESTAIGRAAWGEWAEHELAAYPDKQAAAIDAAAETLKVGSSPQAAAVAARVRPVR